MKRRTLIATASLVAVIVAVGFGTDRALAAEPHLTGMQVIGSDATARYMALGVGKAVVIDLVGDIKDVLVANPTIADAVMQTNHRAYIIGKGLGQTNVYFFDADRRQIGALDVSVSTDPRPLDILGPPVVVSNVITVYLGATKGYSISCTPRCKLPTPTPETAPTQIIETRAR